MQSFLKDVYGKTRRHVSDLYELCYETEEFLLCLKLKRLCDNKGHERVPKKSSNIFHELGKVYRNRTPEKLNLVRSAILFNAALLRKPDNMKEVEDDLNELCSHVLNLADADKKHARLRSEAKHLQEAISEFRNNVKHRLNLIDWDDENKRDKHACGKRTKDVECLQQFVHNWYCSLMSKLMNYCVSVKGKPPCKYALVGMGSLARNEITPYSDFEHVIILEEGVQMKEGYREILEYFRWVSVIFHITVVNIGETIVASAALPYLNSSDNKMYNWFYDGITKNGISFDGLFPHASKFPLGREGNSPHPYATELIKPVNKMLNFISSKKELSNGYHLGDILLSTCFVAGNEKIYYDFQRQIKQIANADLMKSLLHKQLQDDIRNFNPIDSLHMVSKSKCWNIKRIVYRSTTLFVSALGKHFDIKTSSSFDVLRSLERTKVFDEVFVTDVLHSLSIACFLRLYLYAEYDRQEDTFKGTNEEEFIVQFSQIVGFKMPVFYFRTAMKLQRETCRILDLSNKTHVQTIPQVDRLLSCYWVRQHELAIFEAEKLICNEKSCGEVLDIVTDTLLMMGHEEFEAERFVRAFKCFHYVYEHVLTNRLEHSKSDMAYCLQHMSICCNFLEEQEEKAFEYRRMFLDIQMQVSGDERFTDEMAQAHENFANDLQIARRYNEAARHLEEVVEIKEHQQSHRESTEEEDAHLANIYYDLGTCFYTLSIYTKAEKSFQKSVLKHENAHRKSTIIDHRTYLNDIAKTTNLLGECLRHRKKYDLSLSCYHKAIDLRNRITVNKKKDTFLAQYYHNIGACLLIMKQYNEALEFFVKAQDIQRNIGDSVMTEELSNTTRSIGDCLFKEKKYEKSLKVYEESLRLIKDVETFKKSLSCSVALCYVKLGSCYNKLENYILAENELRKAQEIYGHNETVVTLHEKLELETCLGDCLCGKENYQEGFNCYERAITLLMYFSNNKEVFTLSTCYRKIAKLYCKMKKHHEAKSFMEKASEICENTSQIEQAERTAKSTMWIGHCFYALERYEESLSHYTKAADLVKQVHVNDKPNVHLARLFYCGAKCLKEMKQITEAQSSFEKAKLIYQQLHTHNSRIEKAYTEVEIGDCLFQNAMFNESLMHYQEAFLLLQQNAEYDWSCFVNQKQLRFFAYTAKKIGDCFHKKGDVHRCLEHYQQAVAIAKKFFSPKLERDVLLYKACTATCLCDVGRHNEAKQKFLEIEPLERMEKLKIDFEIGHKLALISKQMGDCAYNEESLSESCFYYKKAVFWQNLISRNRERDDALALYFYKVGVCLFTLEKFVKACSLLIKAQNIYEYAAKQTSFRFMANLKTWIGHCLYKQEKFEDALTYYRQAMNLTKQTTTSKQSDEVLATNYYDVATCFAKQRQYDRAIWHFRKAKRIYENIEGIDSSNESTSINSWIGSCFYEKNEFEQCLSYYVKALEIEKQTAKRKLTVAALASRYHAIGACLFKMEKYFESMLSFEKAKLIYENMGLSLMVNDIARQAIWIGDCLYMQQSYNFSLICYQEAVDLVMEAGKQPQKEKILATCCHHIGACLYKMKLYKESKTILLQSKTRFEATDEFFQEDDMANLLTWIGDCCYAQRRFQDGMEYYIKAIGITEVVEKRGLQSDMKLAFYYKNLGSCCYKTERYGEAISCFMKASRISGCNSDPLQMEQFMETCDSWVGVSFCKLSNFDRALKFFNKAILIQTKYARDEKSFTYLKHLYMYKLMCLHHTGKSSEALAVWITSMKCFKNHIKTAESCRMAIKPLQDGDSLQKTEYDDTSVDYYGNKETKESKHCQTTDSTRRLGDVTKRLKNVSKSCVDFRCCSTTVEGFCCEVARNTVNVELAITANWVGIAYFENGQYDTSLKYFEQAIHLAMNITMQEEANVILWRFYGNKGACLYQMEKFGKAKCCFMKATAIFIRNNKIATPVERSSILHMIGRCLLENREYEKCLFVYGKAVDEQNQSQSNIAENASMALYYHDIGVCLYQMKDFRLSLSYFENSKRIRESFDATSLQHKEVSYTALGIGDCLYKLEEYQRALKFYENALAIRLSLSQKPQSEEIIGHIRYKMGACFYRVARYANAIWHFVKSELPTKVSFSETLIWIGDCYCKQGNYSKSLNFYKEAISSTNIKKNISSRLESLPFLFIKSGLCCYRLCCFFIAKQYLEVTAKYLRNMNTTKAQKYLLNTKVWIGSCYFHLGYFESALKCFTEAVVEKYETLQSLDNDPNSRLYFQLMGDCFLKMENYAAARECFDNPKVVFEIIQLCRESAQTCNPIVLTLYSEKCSKSKFQLACFWWKMSQSLVKETSKPAPGYAQLSSGHKCKDVFILLQEMGIKTDDLCQKVTDDLPQDDDVCYSLADDC